MKTYKNDYTKNEDETLWELHEIRNELYNKLRSKPLSQINEEALKKCQTWKKEIKEISEVTSNSSNT